MRLGDDFTLYDQVAQEAHELETYLRAPQEPCVLRYADGADVFNTDLASAAEMFSYLAPHELYAEDTIDRLRIAIRGICASLAFEHGEISVLAVENEVLAVLQPARSLKAEVMNLIIAELEHTQQQLQTPGQARYYRSPALTWEDIDDLRKDHDPFVKERYEEHQRSRRQLSASA